MKDDSPHQLPPDSPDPGQEKWITKDEILKLYDVSERNLKYWRSIEKIRAYTKRQRTYYNENDVRAMVERQARPKKRIRKQFVPKKLPTIDPVLALVIIATGWAWVDGVKLTGPFFLVVMLNLPYVIIYGIAFFYGIYRLILYRRKRNSRLVPPQATKHQ